MAVGIADLPLHEGGAPPWLFRRMVALSEAMAAVVLEEYGEEAFLQRMADPFYFTAWGCVTGFDWHSSGATTVLTAVLREAFSNLGEPIAVCGGKGRRAREAPREIRAFAAAQGIDASAEALVRASRLVAKVDGAVLQDGHRLYHHAFFVGGSGGWTVVQQGLNAATRYARRYHWYHGDLRSFVRRPHRAIVGRRQPWVLDLTAEASEEARRVSVDLVQEGPRRLRALLAPALGGPQATLDRWGEGEARLRLPWDGAIDWEALGRASEIAPRDYEELVALPGVGPATLRALAYIADVIHGAPSSHVDPVKYAFAVGGKDGIPYPVDRGAMDEATAILEQGIAEARVGRRGKLEALSRLRRLVPAG